MNKPSYIVTGFNQLNGYWITIVHFSDSPGLLVSRSTHSEIEIHENREVRYV